MNIPIATLGNADLIPQKVQHVLRLWFVKDVERPVGGQVNIKNVLGMCGPPR